MIPAQSGSRQFTCNWGGVRPPATPGTGMAKPRLRMSIGALARAGRAAQSLSMRATRTGLPQHHMAAMRAHSALSEHFKAAGMPRMAERSAASASFHEHSMMRGLSRGTGGGIGESVGMRGEMI